MSVSLVVRARGRIAGQGSKNKGRNGQVYEASKYLKPWRDIVTSQTQIALLRTDGFEADAEALQVEIVFAFERPAKHYRSSGELREDAPFYYPQTPDIDKCVRAVLDALTRAKAIVDDRRVVQLRITQRYAAAGEPESAVVIVTPLAVDGWVGA